MSRFTFAGGEVDRQGVGDALADQCFDPLLCVVVELSVSEKGKGQGGAVAW